MRCGISDKQRDAATAQKNPAFGGEKKPSQGVTTLARCAGIALRDVPSGLNSFSAIKWVPITAGWY